ncbi:MAG TPA: SpoIIE family protein phosphatase [Bacteroidia bacterium]
MRAQTADSLRVAEMLRQARQVSKANPDSAIQLYENITKANTNRPATIQAYLQLFDICYTQRRDLLKGLQYSLDVAKLYQQNKDTLNYIRQYRSVSVILMELNRGEESAVYSREVLEYAKRKNIPDLLISANISLSEYYSFIGRTDTSVSMLENLKDNLPAETKTPDLAALNMNLGNFYFNLAMQGGDVKNYHHAIFTAKQTINLLKKLKDEEAKMGYSYGLIAACNMELGNLAEAEKYYSDALAVFEHSNRNDQLEGLYYELIQLYIKKGDREKSIYYLEKHDSVSRLLYNAENANSVSEMKVQFETDKKEAENKLLQVENALSAKTLRQQKTINFFIIGGLLVASLFCFYIFYSLRKQRSANAIISHQKMMVEAKHKEISDSIHYAERIQRSFLASNELLSSRIKEYFVFFRPRDVVSGDFYYASVLRNGNFALVTADSTGHGVPGAIMSIINITSLEKAIDQGITQPAEIFNHTRKTIIGRLKKDGSSEGGKDGMDASITVYDMANKKLTLAAANCPVWIVRKNSESGVYELIESRSDKMPIGKHEMQDVSFNQLEVELREADVVYTLTDGFADQFGGENGKKFMSKNLRALLIKHAHLPMQEQSSVLEKTFTEWKRDLEQVDDVCIIGVRI